MEDAHRPRHGGLGWGLLGVLGFSLSLPMARLAIGGGMDPLDVGLGRPVIAGALAVATILGMRWGWPARADFSRLLVVAAGIGIGFPVLTAYAMARVPATHGIIVTGLLPAATAAAAVLRSGERPGMRFWLAAGAGFVCVLAFAAVQGAGRLEPADGLLMVAVVICAAGYAEGAVLARSMGGVRAICFGLVASLPVAAAILLARATPWADSGSLARVTPSGWGAFLYLAVIANFAGFFAWYRGLAQGGIARVGQVQLAQPVLSLAWAWWLLGEAVTPAMMATAAAVLGCVVATQRAR